MCVCVCVCMCVCVCVCDCFPPSSQSTIVSWPRRPTRQCQHSRVYKSDTTAN